MRKTLDTGQSGPHPLLTQFQSFAESCLHRNSSFLELQSEHQALRAKYQKKLKDYKAISKEFEEQSELLEKR